MRRVRELGVSGSMAAGSIFSSRVVRQPDGTFVHIAARGASKQLALTLRSNPFCYQSVPFGCVSIVPEFTSFRLRFGLFHCVIRPEVHRLVAHHMESTPQNFAGHVNGLWFHVIPANQ